MNWLISLLLTLPALNLMGSTTLEPADVPSADQGTSRVFFARLTGDQVVPPVNSNAFGWAIMWLDRSGSRLNYFIRLRGVTLKPTASSRTEPEDVTKIHFHHAPAGSNGPHTLNVFGLPSEDDGDLRVLYRAGVLIGSWDDGDVQVPTPGPGDTKKLSDFMDELQAGEIYIQVHTVQLPDPGEVRGQVIGR